MNQPKLLIALLSVPLMACNAGLAELEVLDARLQSPLLPGFELDLTRLLPRH